MSDPTLKAPAKRILVVDDELNVRITLAANLELAGYVVVEAEDGLAAVERAANEEFDLVVMDIRMPRMDGVEALRVIRKQRPGMQVLLVTGFAVENLLREGVRGGAFTVVQKPVEMEALLALVASALTHPMVLVVDDHPAFSSTLLATLEQSGVRAVAVSDGAAALAAVKNGGFDVCVLDLMMPGMSGVDICAMLPPETSGVSIIAVTGSDDAVLIRRALDSGASQLLRKPFSPDEILEGISAARRRLAVVAAR